LSRRYEGLTARQRENSQVRRSQSFEISTILIHSGYVLFFSYSVSYFPLNLTIIFKVSLDLKRILYIVVTGFKKIICLGQAKVGGKISHLEHAL